MRRPQRGFSLLELMSVITIIAILVAISVPSYQSYVRRANRAVAKSAIMKIAGQQESFYTDRKSYATTLNGLSPEYTAATVYLKRDSNVQAATSTATIYSITLTGASAVGYTITATPINRQASDTGCGTLSYTNTGAKTASGTATDCWSR